MADMKGGDRDYIAHKTKNFDSLVLYRKEKKILPTPSSITSSRDLFEDRTPLAGAIIGV